MRMLIPALLFFTLAIMTPSCKKSGDDSDATKTPQPMTAPGQKSMTAVNVEEPHVPCGRHGSTAKHTGELFPSVFKTPPKPGIKVSCPIKGETFVLTDKHPRTVYKGKTYIFGCNGCKRIFLRDPEAALKKYTFKEAL